MTTMYAAAKAVTDIRAVDEPVWSIKLGDTTIWTRPGVVYENFGILGWLRRWIQEGIDWLHNLHLGDTLRALIGGALNYLPFGLGQTVLLQDFVAWVGATADWAVELVASGLGQVGAFVGFLDDVLTGAVNFVFGTVQNVLADPINFIIGSFGNLARMVIPDAITQLPTQASQFRFDTLLQWDDGYLEIGVADIGAAGDLATQVFRRYSNDGSGANGVGIDLRASTVSIVRRVAGVGELMLNCGAFEAGDVLRLITKGDLHSLYRNGEFIGEWLDQAGSVITSAANMSVGMLMMAVRNYLEPTQYSPALSFLEAA